MLKRMEIKVLAVSCISDGQYKLRNETTSIVVLRTVNSITPRRHNGLNTMDLLAQIKRSFETAKERIPDKGSLFLLQSVLLYTSVQELEQLTMGVCKSVSAQSKQVLGPGYILNLYALIDE